MAFFKFRKAGEDTAAAAPAESVEVMRRRARHRLIGAAVLVLIGVVGFPLLFDTQPRPVQVDIPIDIPDRTKAKPLAAAPAAPVPSAPTQSAPAAPAPAQPAPAAPVVSGPVTAPAPSAPPPKVAQAEGLGPKEEIVPAKPAPKPAASAPKPAASAPKPTPKPDDGARAKALLEGKAAPAATATGAANGERYVVQVGAFADADKARETRLKVERAGLKTYTHVAETKEGKRIRVRVGPFASKAEADRAAEKIKGLDLPAAILTL
ncbi:MAG: SPOR domain-containing protein [Proteobacteria bacterium]|jgi:DedD protein|nr:SPOR domain-containing protein [Pseudomonadota bacterium]